MALEEWSQAMDETRSVRELISPEEMLRLFEQLSLAVMKRSGCRLTPQSTKIVRAALACYLSGGDGRCATHTEFTIRVHSKPDEPGSVALCSRNITIARSGWAGVLDGSSGCPFAELMWGQRVLAYHPPEARPAEPVVQRDEKGWPIEQPGAGLKEPT